MAARFDFYGLLIEVCSVNPHDLADTRRDFSFFEVGARAVGTAASAIIEMHRSAPDYSSLPEAPASVLTPHNVTFTVGAVSYIAYFGR